MKLKKIIAAILALTLMATLASCSCNSNEGPAVRIATGTITGNFNAIYAEDEGDKAIASLIMPSMYASDRSGIPLSDAANGKTSVFNGIDYKYVSFANYESEYDETNNSTTYTIKMSDNNVFSNGNSMSVDDLIFTYYVLCDKSYDGPYKLNESKIEGLISYQYDNTMAPNVEVTDELIAETVSNPPEELKNQVSTQVIKPVLEEARQFCEENWQKYVDRNFGNSAVELFTNLFPCAIDSGYTCSEKTFDEVFEDTLNLYGMNYKAIARNFYGDVEYLDEKAGNIIYEYIFTDLLKSAGGEKVNSISGIKKIDDKTITIKIAGTVEDTEKLVCDIPLLSVNEYSNTSFDYEDNEFGIKRGETSDLRSVDKTPLGYGMYIFENYNKETGEVYLTPNDNYKGEKASTAVKLKHIEEENRVNALNNNEVDLIQISMNSDEVDALAGNTSVKISSFNSTEYEYVGFNLSNLVSGASSDDDELDNPNFHLRNGLGIILASLRAGAIEKINSKNAKIINYPGSSSSWATPMITDSDYKVAYSFMSDGQMIGEGQSVTAAIEEFKQAGYAFSNGKLDGNDGLKTEFNVAIPKYELDNPTMMEIYEQFEKTLTEIGFTVTPTYYEETDEFIFSLASKNEDIWFAKRDTSELSIEKFYQTDADMNYYGYSNSTVDGLLESSKDNFRAKVKNYPEIYKQVMEDAIEVPIYQRQNAICYNPSVCYFDETVNLTEFFGLFSALNGVYFASSVPADVKNATTVAETTTTPAQTTNAITTIAETSSETEAETNEGEAPIENDVEEQLD